jgi:uncharacterized membrane protein (UPF0127 family)
MSNENAKYEVTTFEDPDSGDLILPIPEELMERLGWKVGDQLKWRQTDEGAWVLEKSK